MVTGKNETRNFYANSSIEVNGVLTPVMDMSASYNTNLGTKINFVSNVRDMDLYFENQEEVDKDYDDWKDEIVNIIKGE